VSDDSRTQIVTFFPSPICLQQKLKTLRSRVPGTSQLEHHGHLAMPGDKPKLSPSWKKILVSTGRNFSVLPLPGSIAKYSLLFVFDTGFEP
jgi:hypothetical protein